MLLGTFCPWMVQALLDPPAFVPSKEQLANIRRTATILHQPKSGIRRPFKVFFYGQSITLQGWSVSVANWMRTRFPHIDFTIENRAIGAFSAERLAWTVAPDLFQEQPDLILLHCYGREQDTDRLLREIRGHTTADVIVQNDHLHIPGQLNEPSDPQTISPTNWWAYRNLVWLPNLCARHEFCVADVRGYWKAYLKKHGLKEYNLLADGTHLNSDGNQLLTLCLLAYLDAPPVKPDLDPDQIPRIRSASLDLSSQADPFRIDVHFQGSRIDLASFQSTSSSPIQFVLDGKLPSTVLGTVQFGRTSSCFQKSWPAIQRIESLAPLVPEDWTLTITQIQTNAASFRFRIEGSETGPDGEGDNQADFISKSRRVFIRPENWVIHLAAQVTGAVPPPGFEITWKANFTGRDSLPIGSNVSNNEPSSFTVASGLNDGPHHLLISSASGATTFKSRFVTYSPKGSAAIRVQSWVEPKNLSSLVIRRVADRKWLFWSDNTSVQRLEYTTTLRVPQDWISLQSTRRLYPGMNAFEVPSELETAFFRLVPAP